MSRLRRRLPILRRAGMRLFERYLRYLTRPERIRPWNRVQPLRGGAETYPAMLEAIRSAREQVHLEIYIFAPDRTGTLFRDALIERARAGVQVRMIYDGLGSFSLSEEFLAPLREAGARIFEYAPLLPWKRDFGINKRDHQKILVVDGRVGFTGGINIADEYAPVEQGGGGWYDMHCRIEGPAVHDLAVLFRKNWLRLGGDAFAPPELPAPVVSADASSAPAVQVVSNLALRSRSHMRHAYLRAIRRSDSSISIMNAYFIPDHGLRRAFVRAAARGVNVRVIVPSTSDVKAVYYASRHLYERLLRHGVRIFEWPERMMHAKCGVIDGIWSTIGSYNLDKRSLLHNLEVGLIIVDKDTGEGLQAQFEREIARCKEVKLDAWLERSRWERAKEWIFFQLRYWL